MNKTKLYYVGPKDESLLMLDKLVFYSIVEAVSEEQAKELFLQLFDHIPAERVGVKAIEKAGYSRVLFYEWAAVDEWLSSDEKERRGNPAVSQNPAEGLVSQNPAEGPAANVHRQRRETIEQLLIFVENSIKNAALDDLTDRLRCMLEEPDYWHIYAQMQTFVSLYDLLRIGEDPPERLVNALPWLEDELRLVARLARRRLMAQLELLSRHRGAAMEAATTDETPIERVVALKIHPKIKKIFLSFYLGDASLLALLATASTASAAQSRCLVDLWAQGEKNYLGFLLSALHQKGMESVPMLDMEALEAEASQAATGRQQMLEDARQSGLPIFPAIDDEDSTEGSDAGNNGTRAKPSIDD